MKQNKVILIGGDDHNILGLVRSFGINGIKPYGIIISEKKRGVFTSFSKYWEKNWVVSNEKEAFKLLLKNFCNEHYKPVVILTSDGMMKEIDLKREKLNKYFIFSIILLLS